MVQGRSGASGDNAGEVNIEKRELNGHHIIIISPNKTLTVISSWGFNVIRLLIIWEAIEPEPGVFDENFFKKVDQIIEWAEERGIFVLLDMHQDLYGPAFGGDGAPVWVKQDGHTFQVE